ncbi:MAG: nucleoside-diphosphate kinase [bacterium]
MERTLMIIKPNAVECGNTGAIIDMVERAGLRIVGAKMLQLSRERAEEFYDIHRGKPFFERLISFMIRSPILVLALEGKEAVSTLRRVMGATNPAEAEEGTIRRRFANDVTENAVHGSDSQETASREIAFFFGEIEIFRGDR